MNVAGFEARESNLMTTRPSGDPKSTIHLKMTGVLLLKTSVSGVGIRGHGVSRRSLGLLQGVGTRRTKSGIAESISLPLFARAFDKKYLEKVAFTDGTGKNYTFKELGQKSLTLSKELKTRVKGQEERIAFLCDRNFSFPSTMLATWMANHVAIPLSSSHPESMLEYFVNSTSTKLLLCTKTHADKLNKVAKATNSELLVVDPEELSPTQPGDQDVELLKSGTYEEKGGLILFTSGTTGRPKGVLLTHSNLLDQVRNICDAWEITERDTMLHVLPLHHTHGLIHALISPMTVGARCHMLEKFDAARAWKELLSTSDVRPNFLMGVPTVYIKLLEEFDKTFAKDPVKTAFIKETLQNKMRVMLSGSAALPVPVLEKFEKVSGHRLLERYGMTEIGMALTNPLHGERKPGFVGKPFESVKLRVAEMNSRTDYKVIAEGDSTTVKIYANKEEKVIGDLLVKGPSVFREYWGNPEATQKEFTEDGWFITGDTVEIVDECYKILGRKSVDILKSGGYKLSALEIETQLLSFPEIKEVAVMGISDETWGQRVVAVIAWNGKELTLQEFKDLAKQKVAPYAVPTIIKTMTELPKNHLGKVNKKELVKVFDSK